MKILPVRLIGLRKVGSHVDRIKRNPMASGEGDMDILSDSAKVNWENI